MLTRILIVAAYYLVALAVLAVWVFRDFEAARRRAASAGPDAGRVASRFVHRTSVVLGLLGGGGAALVFGVLLTPAPAAWVIVTAGVAVFAVAALLLEAFLRLAPRLMRTDPLAELRSASGAAVAPATGEPEPPCLD